MRCEHKEWPQHVISPVVPVCHLIRDCCCIWFCRPHAAANFYQRALLANALTSALRLHQRLPHFQLSRAFLAQALQEDSCHYLLYSLILVNSYPITSILSSPIGKEFPSEGSGANLERVLDTLCSVLLPVLFFSNLTKSDSHQMNQTRPVLTLAWLNPMTVIVPVHSSCAPGCFQSSLSSDFHPWRLCPVSIFPVFLFSLLHATTYTKKVLDVSDCSIDGQIPYLNLFECLVTNCIEFT